MDAEPKTKLTEHERHTEIMLALNEIIDLLEQSVPVEPELVSEEPGLYISIMVHGNSPEETGQMLWEAFRHQIERPTNEG